MASYRQSRINEEISKALSEILRGVKDYRLSKVVISVIGVQAAPDLSSAKIYYSYIGNEEQKEVQKGLVNASGYIRTQLARAVDLRHTPKLIFVYDTSMEQGAKIAGLMQKVSKELEESEKREAELEAASNAPSENEEDNK